MIKVKYLMVDVISSYNIIMGQPTVNLLEASLSTLYLSMKYSLPNARVGIIQGNQEATQEFYHGSLRIRREEIVGASIL